MSDGVYIDSAHARRLYFEPSTLETIDRSIFNYIKNLNLFTSTNKGWRGVPVIWSTAERAFHSKKGQDVRDQQGALILPLISINRGTISKPLKSSGAFQGNVPPVNDEQGGSIPLERVIFHDKTANFAAADAKRLNGQFNYPRENGKIVFRTISIPMPVNVDVTYDITIRTEYQQQMNELMTPFMTTPGTINYATISSGEHKYEAFINQDFQQTNNLTDYSSEERKFETKISIKVVGYLVGEENNTKKTSFALRENAVEVKIPRERISLAEVPEHEFGKYYGLSGIPLEEAKRKSPFTMFFGNVPAVGSAGTTSTGVNTGTSGVGGNIVTSENFAETLSNNLIVRELLKANTVAAAANDIYIAETATIRANTESVYVNGILQAQGALNDYAISGNTITFTYNIDASDSIYITYIKG